MLALSHSCGQMVEKQKVKLDAFQHRFSVSLSVKSFITGVEYFGKSPRKFEIGRKLRAHNFMNLTLDSLTVGDSAPCWLELLLCCCDWGGMLDLEGDPRAGCGLDCDRCCCCCCRCCCSLRSSSCSCIANWRLWKKECVFLSVSGWFPCRGGEGGSEGILLRTQFKIEVLGNGISSTLRPIQRVIMSHLFNLRGSTESPDTPPP